MASQGRDLCESDKARDYALQAVYSMAFPMVLKATVDLGLLDIIAKDGPEAHLSASEIASSLQASGSDEVSSLMIDRILNLLATFSIVESSWIDGEGGEGKRVYGIAPAGRFFVRGRIETLAPMLQLLCSQQSTEIWACLKDSVLEGGVAIQKAHGMKSNQYSSVNPELRKLFDKGMAGVTAVSMKSIVDTYQGFEGVRVLVNVAGGIGALLNTIVAKHPTIKGINFDQPVVVESAPSYEGIQQIGGDMFVRVPNGDAILLRNVIHDWSDEDSIKILQKCYEALEDDGKVIIIDSIMPTTAETSDACKYVTQLDLLMMVIHAGGKERTPEEFRAISEAAGFTRFQLVYHGYANSVIELRK